MNIRKLSDEERVALQDGLALAARLVDGSQPLSANQVQELYDAVSHDHPSFAAGVVAVGLAFGEIIAAKTDYEWVRVSDEYGEETMLSPRRKQIVCSPISMIKKRIAQGDEIDIAQLSDDTIRTVQEQIESGKFQTR